MSQRILVVAIFIVLNFFRAVSQTPTPAPVEEDILEIKTELIQAGVLVFDQKGEFIDGLKKDDFELKVDGKPVDISFFESPPTVNADRKNISAGGNSGEKVGAAPDEKRTVVFFFDDTHLGFDSLTRAKKMAAEFIERRKRPDDLLAIFSSSGKIGFLQQFTDDEEVLRAALDRLVLGQKSLDLSSFPMTQYEAQLIDNNDEEVIGKFTRLTMREMPGMIESVARNMVLAKSRQILGQAANINQTTNSALEQTIRFSSAIPGRKTILFVSDGFPPNLIGGDAATYYRRIVDVAARANAAVYSIQAKRSDAEMPEEAELTYRTRTSERIKVQNGLESLARATGGDFIRNQSDLLAAADTALAESSRRYLVAWQPADEASAPPQNLRRIVIGIKNRPELRVRTQAGYLGAAAGRDSAAKETKLSPDQKLINALLSPVSASQLDAHLVLNYSEKKKENANLLGTLQVGGESLDFREENGWNTAKIVLATAVFNSNGKKVDEFNKLITTTFPPGGKRSDRRYNFRLNLKPDLYQIRLALRDEQSGRVASQIKWINIPDLKKKELTLSSITVVKTARKQASPTDSDISVDRIFRNSDSLQYLFFVYNAKNPATPNVATHAKILRNGEVIAKTAETLIRYNDKYPSSLAYSAAVPLKSLPAGRYELQIVANDNLAKKQAGQTLVFEVRE